MHVKHSKNKYKKKTSFVLTLQVFKTKASANTEIQLREF